MFWKDLGPGWLWGMGEEQASGRCEVQGNGEGVVTLQICRWWDWLC